MDKGANFSSECNAFVGIGIFIWWKVACNNTFLSGLYRYGGGKILIAWNGHGFAWHENQALGRVCQFVCKYTLQLSAFRSNR